jgi:hypothetical protein
MKKKMKRKKNIHGPAYQGGVLVRAQRFRAA